MNNLDKQYKDLLQTIIDFGVEKKDRTGTGTKSIFGYTIRHNMREGFPLLTTKKMHWKSIVTELIWFLRGDTNIKFLVDNGCNIWNGDAYKKYADHFKGWEDIPSIDVFTHEIKNNSDFAKRWGELGPIYGRQWRNWNGKQVSVKDGNVITTINDQIQDLINDLKTNPDSRRLIVNAWNVGELDQMVLPPCHYGFQIYTRELSLSERMEIWETLQDKDVMDFPIGPLSDEQYHKVLTEIGIEERAISLMWNQRSVDTFLGLPFNIASYGLLLCILAKEVNMIPDHLIGNLGDTHLYLNHIEQAKEQIGREFTWDEKIEWVKKNINLGLENLIVVEEDYKQLQSLTIAEEIAKDTTPKSTRHPFPLPTLRMPDYSTFEGEFLPLYWLPGDFEIENYQSHPAIKAPLSN
jgi:thymidylate synthase